MKNRKTIEHPQIGVVQLIKHPTARRIVLTVKNSSEIRVSLPAGCPFKEGEKIVLDKQAWIIEQQEKLANKQAHYATFEPGPLLKTRFRAYEIVLGKTEQFGGYQMPDSSTVCIRVPQSIPLNSPKARDGIVQIVTNMLRNEAKFYLPKRTAQLAEKLNLEYNRVTIKNNKTNWGSCSSKRNINLSLHLMQLPDRLIDFVIIHELIHLIIPNHGASFKATMRHHFADADELNRQLKKFRNRFL